MKKYIVPEIHVVELETEMLLTAVSKESQKTISFSLTESATTSDDFAASQYRTNLWGEE